MQTWNKRFLQKSRCKTKMAWTGEVEREWTEKAGTLEVEWRLCWWMGCVRGSEGGGKSRALSHDLDDGRTGGTKENTQVEERFRVKDGFRFGNVNITILVVKSREIGYQDLNIKRYLRVLVVNLWMSITRWWSFKPWEWTAFTGADSKKI